MTRWFYVATVFAMSSSALLAAEGGLGYTPPAPPTAPDPGALLLRLFGLTAGLMALCGVVLWLARRANRPAGGVGNAAGKLKLEGSLALDRRSTVHLVWVQGQTVAVTTDASGLRSIVVLSEPFEQMLDEAARREAVNE